MKRLFILFAVMVAFNMSLPTYAGDNQNQPSSSTIKLNLPHGRPGAPSSVWIEAYLCDNALHFVLPADEGCCLIEIISDGIVVVSQYVCGEEDAVDISALSGCIHISCRTEGNQLFQAELEL
ncbi:MAG: hypothetical protein JFR38_05820 [Muribaculaceae bacterium]|nr:hypothetical protein [Muribaculaceae bacterium]